MSKEIVEVEIESKSCKESLCRYYPTEIEMVVTRIPSDTYVVVACVSIELVLLYQH